MSAAETALGGVRYRKTILWPNPPGTCHVIAMHEDGTVVEFDDPAAALRRIRRRDREALRRGRSTITLLEWRDFPADFEPPVLPS